MRIEKEIALKCNPKGKRGEQKKSQSKR